MADSDKYQKTGDRLVNDRVLINLLGGTILRRFLFQKRYVSDGVC